MKIIKFILSLNEEDIINLITCLITVLASFITIFITIRNTNRNQSKITTLQNDHFTQTLNQQEKLFKLTKYEENLRNAASIMPYFKMLDNIIITESNTLGDHIILNFPINLVNIGNGTAINISILCKSDKENRLITYIDKFSGKKILYIYNSVLFNNIARCNEYIEFGICCDKHQLPAKVHLKVEFQDLMQRTYEQKFSFLYQFGNYNNKALRIETYTPILIKDIIKTD